MEDCPHALSTVVHGKQTDSTKPRSGTSHRTEAQTLHGTGIFTYIGVVEVGVNGAAYIPVPLVVSGKSYKVLEPEIRKTRQIMPQTGLA